ncbi:MAG: hypothetical protein OK404_00015 [Thaumarchaeota archaeon]|nr:hypothetical protein [Nitrososphaerota archaeon]
MTKIRVKLGQAEAEVEADPEHLKEAIDLVPELVSKLPRGRGVEFELMKDRISNPLPDALTAENPVQLPMVAPEKGDSLADVIGKFFSDPWGRERRKLSDVREALQSYGLNYPKQSVAVALLRLAKTSKIRRFKADDGEFVYTSAAMTSNFPQPRGEDTLDELAAPQPN